MSGNRLIDLTDERFGKLVVLERTKNVESKAGSHWVCKCDCGEIKNIRSDVLRKTNIQSCGCTKEHVKIGDKFGRLKVIERAEKKSRRLFWRCFCDCGSKKEIILSSHVLKEGNHRSCGCLKNPSGQKHPNYTGYKDLPGLFFNSIKKGAISRNLPFRVNKKQLWDLFQKQNKKCALTGREIQFGVRSRIKGKRKECTASLDRIDNTKGYTKGNVQWLYKDINKMKNTHTQERFIELCRLVSKQSEGKDG